ncbi:unnamed protein product [Effrenium voratum]|uniref:E3 ubiquitin-protein ligase HERC2 n=1 Tax=Effrenium voratum TaxID=2562239 RepID=A0AA36N6K6_9DINO|nr:unnamed protein product [Effrenium voratum]
MSTALHLAKIPLLLCPMMHSSAAINMTGDGLGGLLLLELAGHNRPALRFAVKNNFIGRREVLIPSHEHAEELFPELSFGQDVQASAGRKLPLAALAASDLTVARVSVGLALAPEGASVVVEAQALQNVLSALGNPTIHVKDKTTGEVLSTMSISGCVPPREYLVYEGGSSASLLNEARQLRAELPVEGGAQQPAGDFTVELEASAGDCGVAQPWVKMRWRALGPEAIFNDATTDAALAATTSTTLPQTTTEEEVGAVSLVASINFKVEGLSFRQLVADEALLEQFESVLRGALQSAAQRAGHVSQDLDVQLSAGSVVVQARMTPAVFDGDSRSSVTESLVQGLHSQAESLQQGLISQLAGIEDLRSMRRMLAIYKVSLAHVVAPQAGDYDGTSGGELVPLWALIAVAVFSVCVMIVAFIAMTVQRRWRHKERQRQGRWAGSGDPITMTRRVRAITRRATAFRNLGWKSAGAPKSGPGSMAVIPTGTADTREREEEKSEIKSEMKYVSEGKSDWKSEKTDTCRSQSKDSPQKTKSSEMKQAADVALHRDKAVGATGAMELEVRLASGRGCRVPLPAAARLRDLKAAAQRRLGRRFLRFAARGHPLDDPELLLSALDLGPGHAVEAIALSADLAAAENCFALFVRGGAVACWGCQTVSGELEALKKRQLRVQRVVATDFAFAALLEDQTVVTWGMPECGGSIDHVRERLTQVRQIWATSGAFAALKEDGTVVTWGAGHFGGESDGIQLTQVHRIQVSGGAFAAVKEDGAVVTWGHPNFGADSSPAREQLVNVQDVQASTFAFAAILQDGTVVTWGNLYDGGDSSGVQDKLVQVKQIKGSKSAFAAILEDGSVVTWGHTQCGGDSSPVQEQLRHVQQIQATERAFAAILGNGSVVTWGDLSYGGDSSQVQDRLSFVQQIQASHGAFAAILADCSVVTWGHPDYGGDSKHVQEQLVRVQCIQATHKAFAAILEDGFVVTWGQADYGGDSSQVQHELDCL